MNVSRVRSSTTSIAPAGSSEPRIARSTSTGLAMSWMHSNAVAKSTGPSAATAAPSVVWKRTRSETPDASALRRASSIDVTSGSNPSTVAFG